MYSSKLTCFSYKSNAETLFYILILSVLPAIVSGFPDKCPKSGHLTNVFVNEDLLKNAKVYQDFSNAIPCQTPGKQCSDPNICNLQLQNVSVSNLVPCCVMLVNGSSICQCVVKMPNSNKCPCPGKDLALVSNQIFNMTGDSKFFDQWYPICSSLHNSWNIYKGRGPVLGDNALPFLDIDEKVGFQYFRADNFGEYYLNFYVEFLLTCKTDRAFISNDLNICDKPCNSTLPFAEIWMDIPGAHLSDQTNAVFMPIKGTSNCDIAANTDNQCNAKQNGKCSDIAENSPCCYSNNCIFPFNPKNDTCPCPPIENNLIMANNAILSCDIILNANNRIYLFKGDNPPVPLVFNWDLNLNGPIGGTDAGIFLFGRGIVILPLKFGGESLYWLAELKLPAKTFKGCLAEILSTLKTKLPFSLEAFEK